MRTTIVVVTLLASTFVIASAAQAIEPTSLPPAAPSPVNAQATGGIKNNTNFIISDDGAAKNGRGGLAKTAPSKSIKAAARARIVKRKTN